MQVNEGFKLKVLSLDGSKSLFVMRESRMTLSFTLYFTCIHQPFDDVMFRILAIVTETQTSSLTANNHPQMKFLIAAAARRRIKKQRANSESAQTSDPQAENQKEGEGSIGVENHHTGVKSAGEESQAPGEPKNAKMARQDGRQKREGPIRKLMHEMADESTKANDN